MTEFKPVQAPLLAFYSAPFYRDVLRNWRGFAFAYLFVFLAVAWLGCMLKLSVTLTDSFLASGRPIIDQMPKFDFHDGKLSIDKPSPYYIRDPKTGLPLIVIDTSGKPLSDEVQKERLIVTKSEFIIANRAEGGGKPEQHTYKEMGVTDLSFDHTSIINAVKVFSTWAPPLLYFSVLPLLFVGHAFLALFYGVVGLIVSSAFKTTISFGGLMRLSVIAMTPSMVFSTIFMLAGVTVPVWGMLTVPLTVIYLCSAVKANADVPVSIPQVPSPQVPPIPVSMATPGSMPVDSGNGSSQPAGTQNPDGSPAPAMNADPNVSTTQAQPSPASTTESSPPPPSDIPPPPPSDTSAN